MHCSKRLTSYRTLPNARVEVTFADGSQVTCDLLIGADGIKSAVRGNLMRELARKHAATGDHEAAHKAMMSSRPVWSGTMAYRSLIPMVKAQQYLDSGSVSLQECHVMVRQRPSSSSRASLMISFHTPAFGEERSASDIAFFNILHLFFNPATIAFDRISCPEWVHDKFCWVLS